MRVEVGLLVVKNESESGKMKVKVEKWKYKM